MNVIKLERPMRKFQVTIESTGDRQWPLAITLDKVDDAEPVLNFKVTEANRELLRQFFEIAVAILNEAKNQVNS